jgi:hypothetical protein
MSTHIPSDPPLHLRTHWSIVILLWLGALFFLFITTISWTQGDYSAAFVLGGFAGLNLVMAIASRGSIRLSHEDIMIHGIFGRYRIRWDEVQTIEITHDYSMIAFLNPHKRLVLALKYAGSNKAEVLECVLRSAKHRNISVQMTSRVPLGHRNVRID